MKLPGHKCVVFKPAPDETDQKRAKQIAECLRNGGPVWAAVKVGIEEGRTQGSAEQAKEIERLIKERNQYRRSFRSALSTSESGWEEADRRSETIRSLSALLESRTQTEVRLEGEVAQLRAGMDAQDREERLLRLELGWSTPTRARRAQARILALEGEVARLAKVADNLNGQLEGEHQDRLAAQQEWAKGEARVRELTEVVSEIHEIAADEEAGIIRVANIAHRALTPAQETAPQAPDTGGQVAR